MVNALLPFTSTHSQACIGLVVTPCSVMQASYPVMASMALRLQRQTLAMGFRCDALLRLLRAGCLLFVFSGQHAECPQAAAANRRQVWVPN